MKVCIIQPSYIPWKGFFHQIAKSDIFVFLDTVQYDKRGWRNRNQIKTLNGPIWLTIPVHAHGTHNGLLIQNVHVQDMQWAERHLQSLRQHYKKAPCFEQEFPWICELLLSVQNESSISKLTGTITQAIAERLGLGDIQFFYASDLDIDTQNPSQRLLSIVKAVGADSYLSGPAAKDYLEVEMLEHVGIQVEWMQYDYPEYSQLYPPFTHQVSILDLILMVGSGQVGDYVWAKPLTACGVCPE